MSDGAVAASSNNNDHIRFSRTVHASVGPWVRLWTWLLTDAEWESLLKLLPPSDSTPRAGVWYVFEVPPAGVDRGDGVDAWTHRPGLTSFARRTPPLEFGGTDWDEVQPDATLPTAEVGLLRRFVHVVTGEESTDPKVLEPVVLPEPLQELADRIAEQEMTAEIEHRQLQRQRDLATSRILRGLDPVFANPPPIRHKLPDGIELSRRARGRW